MQVSSQIAQHLLDVCNGGNWTEVSVAQTLADISWQEAVTVTIASPNSIAALTHHVSFWNRVMMQRISGINPEIPESNGFDVGTISGDAEWKALIRDLLITASELAIAIRDIEEDKLDEPIAPGQSTLYKNVQGTVEHIHYHLGQMVIIKKLIRA
jgi:hypothetical protein